MRNAELYEAQAGIKIAGRNINNLRYADDTTLMAESEELSDEPLEEFSTVYCDPHSQRLWHSHKAEIDVFLELSCFFHDPADVGNLISGSSAFSKTSLNIRKFMVHILLKPGLENFEHYFTSV